MIIPWPLQRWLLAFVFTQVVEVPVYRRTLGVSAFQAFGASLLTHPMVWFVLCSPLWNVSWGVRVAIAEFFAWLMEAAYFQWIVRAHGGLTKMVSFTFVGNALSCGLGLLCHHFFGTP